MENKNDWTESMIKDEIFWMRKELEDFRSAMEENALLLAMLADVIRKNFPYPTEPSAAD